MGVHLIGSLISCCKGAFFSLLTFRQIVERALWWFNPSFWLYLLAINLAVKHYNLQFMVVQLVTQVWSFIFSHCIAFFQAFSGTQNVSSQQKDEAWRVNVRIQGCDLDHGYLCGTMEALNVPMADTPVRSLYFYLKSIRSLFHFLPH